MEGLVKQNRSLAQKILDFIKDLIGKITGKGFKITENYTIREAEMLSEADAKDLQEIRRLFEKALAKTKERVTTATETDTEAQKNTDSKAEGEGDKRYSIAYTTDNKPVVVIEEDILENVPTSEWIKVVKSTISKKFSNGIPVSGRLVKVNIITRDEFTHSRDTRKLSNNQTVYYDKLKSANNLDEIILASTNYVNEDLNHTRNDNFKEFARGDVLLKIGDNEYNAQVVIGFTTGNNMVLYDVINFSPDSFTIKKADTRFAVQSPKVKNSSNVSTTSIIPDNSGNVNTQNTRHSLPPSDSMGNTLSEQQREYFKDSKVVDEKGRLLVVYHGTFADYSVFDINKTSNTNYWGKGWYFTNSEIDAKNNYASNKGADVVTKIEELAMHYFEEMGYSLEDAYDNENIDDYNKAYDRAERELENGKVLEGYISIKNPLYADESGNLLNSNGEIVKSITSDYDGIIDASVSKRFAGQDNVNEDTIHYIVFNSNQFKNLDNKNPTADKDKRFSLPQNAEENKAYSKLVEKHFGTTYNWNETGYLLRNGKKLDFSGKNNGAPRGYRSIDHRDINEAFFDLETFIDEGRFTEEDLPNEELVNYLSDLSGTEAMVDFMQRGNIRIMPETGGINLSVEPTSSQYDSLSDFISRNRGEVILDIDDAKGNTIASVEYSRGTHANRVINDIKNYFANGTIPSVSVVSDFHVRYSLPNDYVKRDIVKREKLGHIDTISKSDYNKIEAIRLGKKEYFAVKSEIMRLFENSDYKSKCAIVRFSYGDYYFKVAYNKPGEFKIFDYDLIDDVKGDIFEDGYRNSADNYKQATAGAGYVESGSEGDFQHAQNRKNRKGVPGVHGEESSSDNSTVRRESNGNKRQTDSRVFSLSPDQIAEVGDLNGFRCCKCKNFPYPLDTSILLCYTF